MGVGGWVGGGGGGVFFEMMHLIRLCFWIPIGWRLRDLVSNRSLAPFKIV